jgi:prepilin-type N-terminal cleavage/methylation domain-containing protein
MTPKGYRARRAAFTLMELLVVIAIIGILASLMLAGVMSVMKSKYDAANADDINQLKIALENFKHAHNIYPPGIIRLCNSRAAYTMANDKESLDFYSIMALNRMWPKLGNFTNIRWDGSTGSVTPIDVVLYGDQNLVYFLTGPPAPGTMGMGFSMNPTDPCSPVGDRKKYFEGFQIPRLVSLHGNAFPSYLDAYSVGSKGNPILYFSASMRRPKNGYLDPLKVPKSFSGAHNDGVKGPYITQEIVGLVTPFGVAYSHSVTKAMNKKVNPYDNPTNGILPFFHTVTMPTASAFSASFTCPAEGTFQLVTAGRDQVFGPGGEWQQPLAPEYDTPGISGAQAGQFDPTSGHGHDDLTSFHDKRMGAS